mgnify:CR=1 FL=1
MQFSAYLASTPLAFILLAGLLGLIIGSFLNVVILRVPRMLEIEWQQQAREILEPDREHAPPAQPEHARLPSASAFSSSRKACSSSFARCRRSNAR